MSNQCLDVLKGPKVASETEKVWNRLVHCVINMLIKLGVLLSAEFKGVHEEGETVTHCNLFMYSFCFKCSQKELYVIHINICFNIESSEHGVDLVKLKYLFFLSMFLTTQMLFNFFMYVTNGRMLGAKNFHITHSASDFDVGYESAFFALIGLPESVELLETLLFKDKTLVACFAKNSFNWLFE